MKTQFAFPMVLILGMLASTVFAGQVIPMEEESYVDDIPFNTHEVFINTVIPPAADSAEDDITFNTAAIAMLYRDCPIPFEAEAEVDDIPFNTAEVCAKYRNEDDGELHGAATECRESELHELQGLIDAIIIDMDEFMKKTLGASGKQVIEQPEEFIQEFGRMIVDDLNFLRNYANSLKSF